MSQAKTQSIKATYNLNTSLASNLNTNNNNNNNINASLMLGSPSFDNDENTNTTNKTTREDCVARQNANTHATSHVSASYTWALMICLSIWWRERERERDKDRHRCTYLCTESF